MPVRKKKAKAAKKKPVPKKVAKKKVAKKASPKWAVKKAVKSTTLTAKLTERQRRVCQVYNVGSISKAEAYRKVYKCSKATAATEGPHCLGKPHVKAYLKTLQAKVEAKAEKKAEDVVAELIKIGFSNIKTVLTDNNEIRDISKLPDDIAAAIESIQSDIRHDSGDSDGYTEKVKVKFHSKLHALTDLGKHFGIFEKDNKQQQNNLADFLKAMKNE